MQKNGENQMNKRYIRIGVFLLLLSSIICSCIQKPSRSLVIDDASFDKSNRTRGTIEFVRVAPDGTVVLKHQGKKEPITVRSSGYTTLSDKAKVIVIASDPELQTATIRMSVEKRGK